MTTLNIVSDAIQMPPELAEIYAAKYGLPLVAPGQIQDTEWARVVLEADGYVLREPVR